jgi:protein-disulfide isomerase
LRSRLIPLVLLALLAAGLTAAIVSISVGENQLQEVQVRGIGEVQELVAGVRQLDDRLGVENTPVTVTVFNDVQCPRCAEWQFETVEPLIERLARTGEGKLEFRHFPLGLKPVTLGAIGAEAAAEQGKQWQYLSLFIRNLDEVPSQGVDEPFLREIASMTPQLEVSEWEAALNGEEARQRAEEDVALATELELTADPVLVIQGPEGVATLEDAPSLREALAAIERVG